MGHDEITTKVVHAAIRGICFPNSRLRNPLLRGEAVQRYFAVGKIQGASRQDRWDALEEVLRREIIARLHAIAGKTDKSNNEKPFTPAERREWQAWEALHLWCFASPRRKQDEIAATLKIGQKTVEYRLKLACKLLAEEAWSLEGDVRRPLYSTTAGEQSARGVGEEVPPYGGETLPAEGSGNTALELLQLLQQGIREDETPPQLHRSDLNTVRGFPASTVEEYLLKRVAAWQERSLTFDRRFVDLSLWLDTTGEPGITPATRVERRYTSLESALADLSEHFIVLIGGPGAGKSTLLEHLDHETASDSVRRSEGRIPFLVRLRDMPQLPKPKATALRLWLKNQWGTRYPALPSLDSFIREGRLLLLLDGLNELPHRDLEEYAAYAKQWKKSAEQILTVHPDNRILFSCRTLDYSTPLSSPTRLVPRLEIQPLGRKRVNQFLEVHLAERAAAAWDAIEATSVLNLVRVPFNLKLLAVLVSAGEEIPSGLAGMFTGFVRGALKREVEKDNPRFDPGNVLANRDFERIGHATRWKDEWELPERGPLFPALRELALAMHESDRDSVMEHGGMNYDVAINTIAQSGAKDILAAGMALGILDRDFDTDVVSFAHQQTHSYFVAKELMKSPQADRVEREWRAARMSPQLPQLLETLHPTEPLPPLPQSGWEEPILLAVEMADDPDAYVSALSAVNLSFAGRCAIVPAIQDRLSVDFVKSLCDELMARSRDLEADLRERVDCAHALGILGDPRFELRKGPDGDFLVPPLVEIASGEYLIGDDQTLDTPISSSDGHSPQHTVELNSFFIAAFPLTVGEWDLFIKAGGYEDSRWWVTDADEKWRAGEITGPRIGMGGWQQLCTFEKILRRWRSCAAVAQCPRSSTSDGRSA